MKPLCNHSAFLSLPRGLRPVVAGWIEDLVYNYANIPDLGECVIAVFDALQNMVYGDPGVALPVWVEEAIQAWAQEVDEVDLMDAIRTASRVERDSTRQNSKGFKKATPEQLKIILEAQKEVGLDFTSFFDTLTSWQADAIIKGIIVISEVQRITGDRHFQLRDIRAAVRDFISSGVKSARPLTYQNDEPQRHQSYERPPNMRWGPSIE